MGKHMRLLVLGLGVLYGANASAQFMSGNDLLQDLKRLRVSREVSTVTPSDFAGGKARGFVMGVHDVARGYSVCTDVNVNATQVEDIAFDYLERNADTRHKTAASIVLVALAEKFPCATSRPTRQ